ncbi:MAG: DNA polymerase III subunit chi [Pseudomonadota bacterium]
MARPPVPHPTSAPVEIRVAEVDFHILGEDSDKARLKAACALIEQAFLAGERVLVWLDDAQAMTAFDNLLWTFGDQSFVPHELLGADPRSSEAPVQLSCANPLPGSVFDAAFSTLVSLRATPDVAALRFARVVEVIDADATRRASGRERFRFYREHGAIPTHHELKPRNG